MIHAGDPFASASDPKAAARRWTGAGCPPGRPLNDWRQPDRVRTSLGQTAHRPQAAHPPQTDRVRTSLALIHHQPQPDRVQTSPARIHHPPQPGHHAPTTPVMTLMTVGRGRCPRVVASSSLHQRHRPAGQPFPAAERAEAFCASAFHRDRRAGGIGEAPLHLLAAGGQVGTVGQHRAVDVARLPPGGPQPAACLGQQPDAVGTGPGRICVREVLADVPHSGRAQQRVDAGVDHGVGVAVADETTSLEDHAAEHQRSAGVVTGAVDVKPQAHPHPRRVAPLARRVLAHGYATPRTRATRVTCFSSPPRLVRNQGLGPGWCTTLDWLSNTLVRR